MKCIKYETRAKCMSLYFVHSLWLYHLGMHTLLLIIQISIFRNIHSLLCTVCTSGKDTGKTKKIHKFFIALAGCLNVMSIKIETYTVFRCVTEKSGVLIWRTVSRRVDAVIPSSRVIQWYGLIHET